MVQLRELTPDSENLSNEELKNQWDYAGGDTGDHANNTKIFIEDGKFTEGRFT